MNTFLRKMSFIKSAFVIKRFISSTIFAVSSGHGKCGVAVIRVSGPRAGTALKMLTCMDVLPKPRNALLKLIKNPWTKESIDKGLVLWFPSPYSYTGEDSCEFQIHGGNAVIAAVLDALGSMKNLRLAEPGEFTKRAFYNGKLDLTEVEGLSDLLDAETEVQRKQAFLQSQGHLSKVYGKWKDTLIHALANMEAYIDFSETENISNQLQTITQTVQLISKEISHHLLDGRKGERLRNGLKTVILGEPNVGKSSLYNILAQRYAAIVTPVPGTTRDVLETMVDINGYPLVLMDTAGLRETEDAVELEGIQRAYEAYKAADLILLVFDCVDYAEWCKVNEDNSLTNYLKEYVENLNMKDLINIHDSINIFNKPTLPVMNKTDLLDDEELSEFKQTTVPLISCELGYGVDILLEELTTQLKVLCGDPTKEHPNMTHRRHRQYLELCLESLYKFLSLTKSNKDSALMAEELRKAVQQIGKITGAVTSDQLLDIIFNDFCIGK